MRYEVKCVRKFLWITFKVLNAEYNSTSYIFNVALVFFFFVPQCLFQCPSEKARVLFCASVLDRNLLRPQLLSCFVMRNVSFHHLSHTNLFIFTSLFLHFLYSSFNFKIFKYISCLSLFVLWIHKFDSAFQRKIQRINLCTMFWRKV